MIRKIIKINEEKCNGCGLCAKACHEGAIGMVNGKAKLLRDDYCDGLGDCLPVCPTDAISFEEREADPYNEAAVMAAKKKTAAPAPVSGASGESALENWPVQIRLVPVQAPYFDGAHLLIAADCTAFACGSFHKGFMKDRITLIGCPKLDAADYSEKLAQIFSANNIETITVIRMEVPCCGGLEYAAAAALEKSGRDIPFNVVTVKTNGDLV
ncbi:MAG TPA: 4Fe-4S binding protein [Candidatus Copromorpha excrementigallinarum]|uniref:4Fe-4S binding protein n=1 Tax=Candidatus Allocopromorpha excrementigallinarum TaxID=2840742 RepID=A0A9D1HZJ8_9FIRM|nr:4Fe-4S binding protein [Candidatus Copromorpha excrementigallinarum]